MLQDLDYTCSFCKIWIIFCLGVVFHIVYGAIVIIGWVCLRYNIGIGGIIFFQHNYHWLGKGKTRVWRFVWCAEVWALWRHSNNIIFRQHILDFDSVIEHIEFLTWSCLTAKLKCFKFSHNEWHANLAFCITALQFGAVPVGILIFRQEMVLSYIITSFSVELSALKLSVIWPIQLFINHISSDI